MDDTREYPELLICIHQGAGDHGLCETCEEEFAADPLSYYEYGDHPEGVKRWRELQEELLGW